MEFWIAVALLAALVTFVVTRPLAHAPATGAEAATSGREADLAVYKDQLAEIDRDVGRGALTAEEADAAKAEVARRLLRAADSAKTPPAPLEMPRLVKALFAVVSLLLPLGSLGLYLTYGAPGLPAQPLSARLEAPAERSPMDDLVAKVEERLRTHPDDGRGWDVIAPVYASQGRFAEAASAFAEANRILGETPERLRRFAEARMRAENGLVAEDARKALTRAVELDPRNKEPLIWLALAKEQDGDIAGAIKDYKAIIESAPADAGWRPAIVDRIKMLEDGKRPATQAQASQTEQQGAGQGPAGPAADAVRAMSPAERAQFINQMVEQLAARLKQNGNDLEGWLKLVRAYKMLGRDSDAVEALASARKSLASDEKGLAALDGLAKELGLGSRG